MDDLEDHPQYDAVLRMVLWGEEEDKIRRRMEVNEVEPDLADKLHDLAKHERIRLIRSGCTRGIAMGAAWLTTAILTFVILWFVWGVIPNLVLYACIVGIGFGAWKIADGMAGYLMAPTKTGSIVDEA